MEKHKPQMFDWYSLKDEPEKLAQIIDIGGTLKDLEVAIKKYFEDEAPSIVAMYVDDLNLYYEFHNSGEFR